MRRTYRSSRQYAVHVDFRADPSPARTSGCTVDMRMRVVLIILAQQRAQNRYKPVVCEGRRADESLRELRR